MNKQCDFDDWLNSFSSNFTSANGGRAKSDEYYVIGLCDEVLARKASRQHRFPFLVGDARKGRQPVKLPVDAYYEDLKLVVEYYERQHTESVSIFNKKQ